MTDNEIIKALDCCDTREWCNSCPLKDNDRCKDILSAQSIDLINRQKAEIERYKGVIKMLENDVASAKSEAIKEFAEQVKDLFSPEDEVRVEIDNLVKEMTEVSDEV